jgi:hypothetical protein
MQIRKEQTMTPERRKFVTLGYLSLCGILVCDFFSLRHALHRSAFTWYRFAFTLAFDSLLLFSFLLFRSYKAKRREPDTLIRLFPESPVNHKERP